VRTEWRTGSAHCPHRRRPAEGARLRVECLRLGVTDLTVTVPRTGMGRGPINGQCEAVTADPGRLAESGSGAGSRRHLPADQHRLLLPCPTRCGDGYAPALVALLQELVPPAVPA